MDPLDLDAFDLKDTKGDFEVAIKFNNNINTTWHLAKLTVLLSESCPCWSEATIDFYPERKPDQVLDHEIIDFDRLYRASIAFDQSPPIRGLIFMIPKFDYLRNMNFKQDMARVVRLEDSPI